MAPDGSTVTAVAQLWLAAPPWWTLEKHSGRAGDAEAAPRVAPPAAATATTAVTNATAATVASGAQVRTEGGRRRRWQRIAARAPVMP